MKKVIATIALVLMSQAALADVQVHTGTLYLSAPFQEETYIAVQGDIAESLYNTLPDTIIPELRATAQLTCSKNESTYTCLTNAPDITSFGDQKLSVPVTAIFDSESGSVLSSFEGVVADAVYNAMANNTEAQPNIKIGKNFWCNKGETADASACLINFDSKGTSAPTEAQVQKFKQIMTSAVK